MPRSLRQHRSDCAARSPRVIAVRARRLAQARLLISLGLAEAIDGMICEAELPEALRRASGLAYERAAPPGELNALTALADDIESWSRWARMNRALVRAEISKAQKANGAPN